MTYFKIVRKTLEISGSSRNISIDLRAEVFSYDKNVNKFLFELTSKEAEIDLTGATVRTLLTYVGNDGKKGIIEDNGGIESYTTNQIFYMLPEELRGYEGTVVMGLYVDLPTGESIDIQNVQFKMLKSSIDDGAGVAGMVYFKSFEDWLIKVKEKALLEIDNIDLESDRVTNYADKKIKEYDDKFVQSDQKMNELQQSQTELSDQLTETNKKIEEADVYRKDEVFNKSESSANVVDQVIGKEKVRMTFLIDFADKNVGSTTENANLSYIRIANTLGTPRDWGNELSQDSYSKISRNDGSLYIVGTKTANSNMQIGRRYNIIHALTEKFGENFWISQGLESLSAKIAFTNKLFVGKVKNNCWGFGSSPTGNNLTVKTWLNNTKWSAGSGLNNSAENKRLTHEFDIGSHLVVDSEGFINSVVFADVSDGTISSMVNLDYAQMEFTIELSLNDYIKSMMAAYHVENIATKEEAEAGEDNTKIMTPLQTANEIERKTVSIAGNQTIGGIKNFKDGLLFDSLPVQAGMIEREITLADRSDTTNVTDVNGTITRIGNLVFLAFNFNCTVWPTNTDTRWILKVPDGYKRENKKPENIALQLARNADQPASARAYVDNKNIVQVKSGNGSSYVSGMWTTKDEWPE